MNVFISQPMNGLTDDVIKKRRLRILNIIKKRYPTENIYLIDSFFENAPHDASPIWFLGKSLEYLSQADLVFFSKDWEKARGYVVEHMVCRNYHIPIVHEV